MIDKTPCPTCGPMKTETKSFNELEETCINASIRLLQGLKGTLSASALQYRMKEIGEELIRISGEE